MTTRGGKPIRRMDLVVTTACVLRCDYCFVKLTGRTMARRTAEAAVDLLLDSPGEEKLLLVYGGEPLLEPELLQAVVRRARMRAEELEKRLTICLGTNGVLLDAKTASFLRRARVKVAVSVDGRRCVHDRHRRFAGGQGSFDAVVRGLLHLFSELPVGDVSALCGVHPESAAALDESLRFLSGIGFDSVNIEPIEAPGAVWSAEALGGFSENLARVARRIIGGIPRGEFFFLNSVNRELGDGSLSGEGGRSCPYGQSLQVYPDGELAFSPFLINAPDRERYLVGSVSGGISPRYALCEFEPESARCGHCRTEYAGSAPRASGEALRLRNDCSLSVARAVAVLAPRSAPFARYAREAKRRVFE